MSLAPNHHYFSIDALDLATGKPPAGFTPIRGRFGANQIIHPSAYVVPGNPARIFASAHLAPDFARLGADGHPEGELTAWDFRTGQLIARCERLYPHPDLVSQGWRQRFLAMHVRLGETCDRKTSGVITEMVRTVPAKGDQPERSESRALVHDMKTGRPVMCLGAKPGVLQRAYYSFDDKYIVTDHMVSGGKPVFTVWDADGGRELWSRHERFWGFTFDGEYVAFEVAPRPGTGNNLSVPWPTKAFRLATGEPVELPHGEPVASHPPMPDDILWDIATRVTKTPSIRAEKLFGTLSNAGLPSYLTSWLSDRDEVVTVWPRCGSCRRPKRRS